MAIFNIEVCHLFFLAYTGYHPLERGVDWYCGDQSLPCTLSGTSPFLCGFHCPVRGGVWSLVWGRGRSAPQICFHAVFLIFGVRQEGLEHPHLERSH